jgi:DNA helicase II / ATP-dependent DNA helicase PcrA
MTHSKYQIAIFEAVQNTTDNLVIDAVAGSGKTTTIVKAAELVPPTYDAIFVAFNKHIATELQSRLPSNMRACTMNSLGFQIVKQNFGKGVRLDQYKTESVLKDLLPKRLNPETGDPEPDWKMFYGMKGTINRLVSLFKANCYFVMPLYEEIYAICDRQGIDLPETDERVLELFGYLEQVYKRCLDMKLVIDFDDQIFYPIYFQMDMPSYDLVMVDESQDLNPIQIELILRCGKRFVMVGDERQAIYMFRGADPKAMRKLTERSKAKRLPLSICWRCSKAVVREAQKIVPHIEFSNTAPEGQIENISEDDFDPKDGDYVLCRTTAPLVSACLKLIRQGRKAQVKGRDIGTQLLTFVDQITGKRNYPIKQFVDVFDAHKAEKTIKLSKLRREFELAAFMDRCDTIDAIMEQCESSDQIKQAIARIFSDDTTRGITLCTVHRSKGLETDNVWILRPDLMPHKMATTEDQIEQEMNLMYVAITRAKQNLRWVFKKGQGQKVQDFPTMRLLADNSCEGPEFIDPKYIEAPEGTY